MVRSGRDFRAEPAARACCSPRRVRGMSVQPVKREVRFRVGSFTFQID